jgi:hypothetical protein
MEYVFYILGVLAIGLLCMLLIRYWSRKNDREAEILRLGSSRRQRRQDDASPKEANSRARLILQREFRQVPTPWGWPRHVELNRGGARPDLSDAMQSFANRLIRQKELVNRSSTNPRISNSVRALLEDRYSPVMKSVEYRKVKAPLLRDPSEPFDQMDDFGSRKLKPARKKMQSQAEMRSGLERVVPDIGQKSKIELKDIKLPWGW